MLSLRNNSVALPYYLPTWNLTSLRDNTPNLQIFDASHLQYYDLLRGDATCPNLLSLNLTHSYGKKLANVDNKRKIIVPKLKFLYLQHFHIHWISDPDIFIRDISEVFIFKAPALQVLGMSFNQLSTINKKEAAFLSSMPLTHLDLSSNQIIHVQDIFLNNLKYLNLSYTYVTATDDCSSAPCAVTHFKNLSNIEILSLRFTIRMDFIPRSILSQSDHPFLHTLEWTGSLVCDCNAQELQTWLLTDKRVCLGTDRYLRRGGGEW